MVSYYVCYRMLLGGHGNIWENRTLFKKAKINIEELRLEPEPNRLRITTPSEYISEMQIST